MYTQHTRINVMYISYQYLCISFDVLVVLHCIMNGTISYFYHISPTENGLCKSCIWATVSSSA